MSRGYSPSLHTKTGDLGVRNRGSLNSSFKRQAMTAHPPAHPASNGIHNTGPSGAHDNGNSNTANGVQRPGSAPKMRTHTPNADTTTASSAHPTSSLVLRSQPSNNSTAGGLNSSMSLSKHADGNGGTGVSTSANSSKNMLNSFRNGPIK